MAAPLHRPAFAGPPRPGGIIPAPTAPPEAPVSPAPADDPEPLDGGAEPSRWERVEALFDQCLDLAAEERGPFLDRACGDDADLRREVLELLAADAGATAAFTPPSQGTMGRLFDAVEDDRAVGRRVGAWVLERLLGAGGMGKVYLARRADGEFDMAAAIKLVRPGLATDDVLARFRHERATLARLEHPHIARLLDGGATEEGLPFLAMEYVPGESLDAWCDGRQLDLRARLELLLPVLDAVATAHRQAVVHRDLKPANVLVDHAGTPRLLDFGIAKVLDAPEESIATTRPGERPMTPAYASPEQVLGEAVGTASDVWSLGVMLCELVTGRLPFEGSARDVERDIVERDGPRPSRLVAEEDTELAAARGTTPRALARSLRGDLDAIVRRAMQREAGRRYPSVEHLKDDIERHLAGLPVTARPDDTTYIVGRFVRRHRLAVGALVVVLAALTVAVVTYVRSSQAVRTTLEDMGRLSDGRRLDELLVERDLLWPAGPDQADAMQAWIDQGRELVARLPRHRATRDELATRLADEQAGRIAPDPATTGDTSWWLDLQQDLVGRLEAFAAEDPHGATLAEMERRLGLARDARRLSLEEPAQAWSEAAAAVAADPTYQGLELEPQLFLAPLGPDPTTGLQEFWHVQTGRRPERGDDGRWIMDGEAALVLVLLPGVERGLVGAQPGDPSAPHHDPAAAPEEGPVRGYDLAPYLLSRYELTQGQWLRLTGRNPSEYHPGHQTWTVDLSHPVEQVSWDQARSVLERHGLRLPSEVQWELATRAGTDTPWWTGPTPAGLDAVANLADLTARDGGGSQGWNYRPAEEHGLDDGFVIHAPVGSLAPNALGLHDLHGNVWEWCADELAPYFIAADPLHGTRLIPEGAPTDGRRMFRGGGYGNPPSSVRSSHRMAGAPDEIGRHLGVRPAMLLAE